MASRWKPSLIAFLLFLTRLGFSHESDELDDLLPSCHSKHEVWNGIVDVTTSMARGAQLLQGRMTNGYELCAEQCCEDGKCDLALYRLEGLSDHGNNCYFIRCDNPANCKIIQDDSFVFAFMSSGKTEGGDAPGRENTRIKPTKDTQSTIPPTAHNGHASPSTENPPTEKPSSTDAAGTEKETDALATEKTPSPETPVMDGSDSDPDSTDAPPVQLSDTPPPSESSGNQHQQLSTVSTEEVDDCEQNGCNGTGVIVFGVLGGIAVLLLSLIVLVLVKRLYDFYKRKQFGNVDYLINGMYA